MREGGTKTLPDMGQQDRGDRTFEGGPENGSFFIDRYIENPLLFIYT